MKRLWHRHGTALLGALITLLGSVAVMTPAELQVLGLDAHTALRVTVIATGVLTFLRGFLAPRPDSDEG